MTRVTKLSPFHDPALVKISSRRSSVSSKATLLNVDIQTFKNLCILEVPRTHITFNYKHMAKTKIDIRSLVHLASRWLSVSHELPEECMGIQRMQLHIYIK